MVAMGVGSGLGAGIGGAVGFEVGLGVGAGVGAKQASSDLEPLLLQVPRGQSSMLSVKDDMNEKNGSFS